MTCENIYYIYITYTTVFIKYIKINFTNQLIAIEL